MAHLRLVDNAAIVGHNRNPIYGLKAEPLDTLANTLLACCANAPSLAGVDLMMAAEQADEAMKEDLTAAERGPLSVDQAAAIYFYTMETPFYEVCVRVHVCVGVYYYCKY
jgi:hypothetical protein